VAAPVISQIYYTDSSYINNALTVMAPTGGYIKIIGTGFQAGSTVYVGGQTSNVVTKTFVDSTEIRIQVAALTAATYSLMVFNTNNTGAIYANGIVSSTVPTWTIAAGTVAAATETRSVSSFVTAPSNSKVTYSITGGELPAGVLLDSRNARLYGTAPTVATQTIYTFTVTAIDAELQTSSREYSYTINPDVITWNVPTEGATLSGYIGAAFTQSLSAVSAVPGQPVTYTVDSLPTGLALSGPSITGTPSIIYSTPSILTATATVTGKTSTRNVNWSITAPPAGPWSWGWGTGGVLGQGDVTSRTTPTLMGKAAPYSPYAIVGGFAAVKPDGTLWTWGLNGAGALGLGDTLNRSSPVQVGALTNWLSVHTSGSGGFTMAIKTNGTLWGWGSAFYGNLGLNDAIQYRSSPMQVGALTTWKAVSASSTRTLATQTNGTLWSWGSSSNGQLGLGTIINRSSPTQVGVLTNWKTPVAGDACGAAIKTDGTLWAWGYNLYGTLGQGDTIHRSSPVQVGTLTTWSIIGSGSIHLTGVDTAGRLWAWGLNNNGQLGQNDMFHRSSPTQVGALTDWGLHSMVGGMDASVVIKANGTLWTWGSNSYGSLGLGDTFKRSSPVQVGSLTRWQYTVQGGTTASIIAMLGP
jgi:alpha-tubulin suppressor-like RCC1 family protein